ncbi:MAG: hypothetical protein KC419_19295 [Anaerolineales bacterium]|nr:hypothetical protein [Anaerolineales bacterium]MCA9930643.1 hypothetical protein [Anaerolineales bacterium]
MNSRTIAIIIFIFGALVLAVVGALIFFQNQDQPQAEPPPVLTDEEGNPLPTEEGQVVSEDVPPTETPALVEVVVSLQTVPRGHQMTQDILTTDLRNVADVGSNVITNMEDAVGLFARTDIFQGETLTRDSLVRDQTLVAITEYGPSALIPSGFIAAAIPLSQLKGVAGGLSEGDFIDIMATFELYRIDEQFQTFLENDAVFFMDQEISSAQETAVDGDTTGEDMSSQPIAFSITLGRFEELATGDLVLVSPSEQQRPIPITMVLQNAKVIQVGDYVPRQPASERIPTATPEPLEEGEPTPTAAAAPTATATPPPPDVLVVALLPQQQLFLKHALEVGATVDYALRSANDNQLFAVDNVDLQFLLDYFNIEVPPNFDFTIDVGSSSGDSGGGASEESDATPAPTESVPEG